MKPLSDRTTAMALIATCSTILFTFSPMVQAQEPVIQVLVGPGPDGQGGGPYRLQPSDELSDEVRQEIWARINENVLRLGLDRNVPPHYLAANPTIGWPMSAATVVTDYGYHGISNFVDQDPNFPNSLKDYNCGTRTYDLGSGYNHQGVDFFTWPFGWRKMDFSEVEIVAVARGTITFKQDGNFDRSCSFGGTWNAVYIQHTDGSIAWYGHMKNGSTTPKSVGQTVAQGEYLGIVGSSGSSTGPHLHMELYDSSGSLNEAYQGTCNVMNASSWWANQRPYFDSAVNHISTNQAAPVLPACPTQETPNERNVFNSGDPIYFVTYYRDQLMSQTTTYTLYRPNGTVYTSWTHNSPVPHYAASYWYWSYTSFPGVMNGIWRFEASYEGQTYTQYFSLGPNAGSGRVPGQQTGSTPLRIGKSGSDLQLSWSASCRATDVDYEVYEGILGSWSSHVPRVCTTAAATALTLAPGIGSRYYVIVPTDTINEGSHGRTSAGVERSTGASTCLVQQIAVCP